MSSISPWIRKAKVACLLRDQSALMFWDQFWNKFGGKSASFLGVEITNLLRNIKQRSDDFVMAFLRTLLVSAASSTNLNGKLLTGSISHKLARLLLHILGGARGLVHSPALLRSLTSSE